MTRTEQNRIYFGDSCFIHIICVCMFEIILQILRLEVIEGENCKVRGETCISIFFKDRFEVSKVSLKCKKSF